MKPPSKSVLKLVGWTSGECAAVQRLRPVGNEAGAAIGILRSMLRASGATQGFDILRRLPEATIGAGSIFIEQFITTWLRTLYPET